MSCATPYVTNPSACGVAPRNIIDGSRAAAVVGPAPEVVLIQVFYRGVSLGCRQLDPVAGATFRIGAADGVDAPVSEAALGATEHTLVSWTPGGFVVHTTPAIHGAATVGGRARPLSDFGPEVVLSSGQSVRIDCGEMTFFVEGGARPPQVERPRTQLRWAEHRYTLLSGGGMALFLLASMMVPPESNALAGGMFSFERHFVPFQLQALESKTEIPDWIVKTLKQTQPGDEGKAHKGEQGAAGNPKLAKNIRGRFTQKGGGEFRLTKELAREQATQAGVLGVLHKSGGAFQSIFGEDKAFGSDSDTIMGNLIGSEIGGFGAGGLSVTGTGTGGGGTGEGTLGTSTLGTLGRVGVGKGGPGYGVNLASAALRGKTRVVPDLRVGQVTTRGALDKEIVRRIIRRHINEVKYCYEQELVRKPDLAGRVMAQFTIAGTGQVIASVLQSSSMGNPRVENCILQSIKRWEFPRPEGGGMVIVSYPFMLTPAGGGGE